MRDDGEGRINAEGRGPCRAARCANRRSSRGVRSQQPPNRHNCCPAMSSSHRAKVIRSGRAPLLFQFACDSLAAACFGRRAVLSSAKQRRGPVASARPAGPPAMPQPGPPARRRRGRGTRPEPRAPLSAPLHCAVQQPDEALADQDYQEAPGGSAGGPGGRNRACMPRARPEPGGPGPNDLAGQRLTGLSAACPRPRPA